MDDESEPRTQYGVRDEYGELWEWSCGCPRLFDSVDQLLAYCDLEADDAIVTREITETPWEPVRHVSQREVIGNAGR